jgi:hypothetical protein
MAQGAGSKLARKPAKIYMGSANLLRAVFGELSREYPIGTIRETIVQHQLNSAGLQCFQLIGMVNKIRGKICHVTKKMGRRFRPERRKA